MLSQSLTTASRLNAARSGESLTLSWNTNVGGLTLQSPPAVDAERDVEQFDGNSADQWHKLHNHRAVTGAGKLYRLQQP